MAFNNLLCCNPTRLNQSTVLNEIILFPNPCTDVVVIQFFVDVKSSVKIKILNLLGMLIETIIL